MKLKVFPGHRLALAASFDGALAPLHLGAHSNPPDLAGALRLFRLTRAKDVFVATYRADLGRRLLARLAAVDASPAALAARVACERAVLGDLEKECGNAFVAKLEGMCKDAELAADVGAGFAPDDVDAAVFALTSGYWPAYAPAPLVLPPALVRARSAFEAHYLGKFQGRRLAWHHDLDRAAVAATYGSGAKLVDASLPQALVLLALDGGAHLARTDLADATGLGADDVDRVVASLAAPHALVAVAADGRAFANPHFAHPLHRLAVPPPAAQPAAAAAEGAKVAATVSRDRQYAIDATIVRIMKARKTLSHQMLLADLLAQLKHPASPHQIKLRIESLIDREYVERDPHDPALYNYLA